VKPFLVTAMSVPASVVDRVWERLKLHYSDPQHPVSLKAYVKRLVNDLCPPKAGGVLQDELGEDYLERFPLGCTTRESQRAGSQTSHGKRRSTRDWEPL
jgi:hypothetical protein